MRTCPDVPVKNLTKLVLLLGVAWPGLSLATIYAPGSSVSLMTEMDRETQQLEKMTRMIPMRDDCAPIRVGGVGRIDIQHLSCSAEAKAKDGQSYRISENIAVPEGIAHRFNFWRRVYSLWSKNQFVLHVGEFPEVVLEIHDSTRITDVAEKNREKSVKPWMDVRRRQYQQIFWKLHSLKTVDVAQLSPAEQRVVQLFSHIPHKNKYQLAAQSIRVQRGQREYIQKGLEVAPRYLPHIEAEFKKGGLNPELARIAFIESSFNLQALSKVGASGVYQIMPETGHDYMIIAGGIDERNDPIKASRAAARLLTLNHRILGEWPLAITAYNHGVGGIRRAMQATGSNDIVTLINKYDGPNFGFASKNFYAGFLGMLATLNHANKVFPELKPVEPLQFDTVRVGGLTVAEVKAKHKVNVMTMRTMNPDISWAFLKSDAPFPERYVLKIPAKAPNPNVNLVTWKPSQR